MGAPPESLRRKPPASATRMQRPRKKKERLKQCAPDLYGLVEENRHDIDEALAALKCREDKARAEAEAAKEKARAEAEASASEEKRKAHERSVELADCIKRGEDSAVSIVGRFVGDVSQIISAHHSIDEAVAVLGDRIIPQPLMTKDRMKQLREALALLQKEFGL
jgi:hypothetical protein